MMDEITNVGKTPLDIYLFVVQSLSGPTPPNPEVP